MFSPPYGEEGEGGPPAAPRDSAAGPFLNDSPSDAKISGRCDSTVSTRLQSVFRSDLLTDCFEIPSRAATFSTFPSSLYRLNLSHCGFVHPASTPPNSRYTALSTPSAKPSLVRTTTSNPSFLAAPMAPRALTNAGPSISVTR